MSFKKIKNFICAEIFGNRIVLHIRLDVKSVEYEEGFSRDTSNIGNWAAGDVEVVIHSSSDLAKAKLLIDRAYNEN